MLDIIVKVNCINNDKGAYCKDKKVKRSLFGLGARCCSEYHNINKCPYKVGVNKNEVQPPLTINL
jgi:hypothetical protein